jgi:hypothetical protein
MCAVDAWDATSVKKEKQTFIPPPLLLHAGITRYRPTVEKGLPILFRDAMCAVATRINRLKSCENDKNGFYCDEERQIHVSGYCYVVSLLLCLFSHFSHLFVHAIVVDSFLSLLLLLLLLN